MPSISRLTYARLAALFADFAADQRPDVIDIKHWDRVVVERRVDHGLDAPDRKSESHTVVAAASTSAPPPTIGWDRGAGGTPSRSPLDRCPQGHLSSRQCSAESYSPSPLTASR